MKVLILGNGGREHAIGLKIKKDQPQTQLFFASGNGGTESLGKNIAHSSVDDLLFFALKEKIDITIVGSEALLMEGIVDMFTQHQLNIFGPHKAAAMLEGDKAFAKSFMNEFGIRTASHQSFSQADAAKRYLKTQSYPLVIKATGLAAGKGVFIVNSIMEAEKCVHELLIDQMLGHAGNEIIIEEFLQGFEVSILSVYNKKIIYPFISAKDHKKVYENETGPNTGGMGAIAPNPLYTPLVQLDFEENILAPTLRGLTERKMFFSGVIFFGIMVVNNQCYLLEYNMRMGDPETQAILPLLQSDFLSMLEKAISSEELLFDWLKQTSCCVVLVSNGYPFSYETNKKIINGIDDNDTTVVMAGVKKMEEDYYTTGGRVMNIVALGNSIKEAKEKAYLAVDKIHFEGKSYRKDIGGFL